MSLSARIAIGPSRWLAAAEAAMVAGAIIVTCTTATMHIANDSGSWIAWVGAAVTVAFGVRIGVRRWVKRVGSCGHEIHLNERDGVSIRFRDRVHDRILLDIAPRRFELTEAAMVWPEFAMLSLMPTSCGTWTDRTIYLPVVRAELDAGVAWKLQRYLLWAQRRGMHPATAVHKDIPG